MLIKPILLVVFRPAHRTSDLFAAALPADSFRFILPVQFKPFQAG